MNPDTLSAYFGVQQSLYLAMPHTTTPHHASSASTTSAARPTRDPAVSIVRSTWQVSGRIVGKNHGSDSDSNDTSINSSGTDQQDESSDPRRLKKAVGGLAGGIADGIAGGMAAGIAGGIRGVKKVGKVARAGATLGTQGDKATDQSEDDAPESGDEDILFAQVQELGQGVPIVFLHGLVGLNEHWEGVVDRVCGDMRCILFELPLLSLRGPACSIQGVTRLTAEFLQERVKEPVVLVGNSFGGHVALRLALEHPELVRGLVLAGSSGLIEKSLVSDIQIRPSKDWLRRKIGELFYDQSLMREADLERAHKELTDRGGARAMVKLSRSARRDHLGSRIGEITAPTLLLWGKQDIVTPPDAADGFKQYIHNSKLVWFEECGHVPMIERPEGFAQAMKDFVKSLPADKR